MHQEVRVHICTCVFCTYVRVYIYIYVCAYVYTCTYTCMCIHIAKYIVLYTLCPCATEIFRTRV